MGGGGGGIGPWVTSATKLHLFASTLPAILVSPTFAVTKRTASFPTVTLPETVALSRLQLALSGTTTLWYVPPLVGPAHVKSAAIALGEASISAPATPTAAIKHFFIALFLRSPNPEPPF